MEAWVKIVLMCAAVLVPLLVVGLWLIWRYKWSIKVVPPNLVAIMLFFGRPREDLGIYESGPTLVPYVPIKWDGYYPWQLATIPTKPINFKYEGKLEHRVWSSDRQLLTVEANGFVRFPYNEIDSLILMIRSDTPTNQEGLQELIEDEIISALRDIMAGFTLEEAIKKSNLTALTAAVQQFLIRPDGLFAVSGICGNNPQNFTPGTGEVVLRIEQVNPTQKMQEAMEAPVVARFQTEATKQQVLVAKEQAKIDKTLAGDPILLAMEDWVENQKGASETKEQAKARLIGGGSYAKHELIVKDIILAKSGNLQVIQTLIGSPDGSPLPSGLQYISVGGGGGAGVLVGGKGNQAKNPGGKGNPKGGNPSGGQKDVAQLAEDHFRQNGKYPPWDPLKRKPN